MRLAWGLILSSVILATTATSRVVAESPPVTGNMSNSLPGRLAGIAGLITPSPAITIAAGRFLMGSTRVDDDPYGLQTQYDDTELPQHKVWLDAYEIDRDEVSLGEYLAFLRRDRRSVPEELQRLIWHMITVHAATDEGLSRWPALYVTWIEAEDFCHAVGKRLPTEAEWEYAARGGLAGKKYSWGNDLRPGGRPVANWWQGNFPDRDTGEDGFTGRAPVKSFPPNGYGLYEMAANVWEWCSDWYEEDYYSRSVQDNPTGPASSKERVIRGGSWMCAENFCTNYRVAARSHATPDSGLNNLGFRCVRDIPSDGQAR